MRFYSGARVKEDAENTLKGTCLNKSDIQNYLGYDKDKPLYEQKHYNFYGWHISNLIIYDNPRELSEFFTDDIKSIKGCEYRCRVNQPQYVAKHGGYLLGSYACMKSEEFEWCENCIKKQITKPPQSWCYVEDGGAENE